MSNNEILKKLRVALQLKDDDIINILALVDYKISKTELSAFFRAEDHPNYVLCGDQIMRNFLNALVIYKRGPMEPKAPAKAAEKTPAKRIIVIKKKKDGEKGNFKKYNDR
jgi:uncharacterized protein YehS (DUF1456 family)